MLYITQTGLPNNGPKYVLANSTGAETEVSISIRKRVRSITNVRWDSQRGVLARAVRDGASSRRENVSSEASCVS
jgi:hypothetical protein